MNLKLILAGIGALSIITAAAGLYWKGRAAGVAAERPKVVEAQGQAATSRLEAEGARQTTARVDLVVRQGEAANQSLAKLSADLQKSENANEPLDAQRGARLRDHDRELCQLAGDLSGCERAQAGNAGAGQSAVHALRPATEPDPGGSRHRIRDPRG